MYKSLIDLCTFEIKARLAKAKNRKADEQLIRNKRSTKKVKKLDEQLTQKKEEKLADIQVKNLGEQLIQSSQDTDEILKEIILEEKKLVKHSKDGNKPISTEEKAVSLTGNLPLKENESQIDFTDQI